MLSQHKTEIQHPIWQWKLAAMRAVMFTASIAFTIAVFLQVVTRYVFNYSIFGIEEFAAYTGIVMYFIGAAYATHERSHISASVVESLIGAGRVTAALHALTRLAAIVLSGYIAWATWGLFDFTTQMGTKSVELRLPMVWVYGTMVVGLVLMTGYFVLEFYDSVITLLRGQREEGGHGR